MSLLRFCRRLPRPSMSLTRPAASSAYKDNKANVSVEGLPWHISSCVLVERIPLIVPELTDLQHRMRAMLLQVETERSLKCDHELRHEADLDRSERRKRGELLDGEEATGPLRTATDDEDDWRRELDEFAAASRTTEADAKGDVRSTQRALERPLRLMVRQGFGGEFVWDLPTAIRAEGETLRQTAERALWECCGEGLQVQMLGNAPWGFYKQTYSKKVQEKLERRGQKVFVFKAHYVTGEVLPQKDKTKDFCWAVLEEMEKELDKRTKNAVEEIIYDESP